MGDLYEVSFRGDEIALSLTVVMLAQPCEYTKNNVIVWFKQLNWDVI